MMQTMRENTKKILWVLIIAFLGTIVFAWGLGGFDRQGQMRSGILATVNGDKIMQDQFDQRVENRIQQEREKNNNQEIDENRTRTLRSEVWDGALNELLLSQELDRLGISIGSREVAYELRNNPPQYVREAEAFKKDGQFDQAAYEEFLKNPRAINEIMMLEADVSARLRQQRLIDAITASAMVSPAEMWDEWTDKNTTFKLRYVKFPASSDPRDTALVSEADIEAEYKARQEEYQDPEQRKVWFVSFREQPSAADSLHSKEMADEIFARAKKGEDFAELARTYSEDNSAQNGGSTGYFGRGRMVKPFEDAVFNGKIGDIVGPVQTQFGWHVIKVTGHKDATKAKKGKKGTPDVPAQDEQFEAAHVLFKFAASSDTKDRIREQAKEFSDGIQKKKSAHDLAKQYNVKIDTSGFFSLASAAVPKVGKSVLAAAFAFDSKVGAVSFPYYIRNSWFVIGVQEVKKAGPRPLAEVRKLIQSQLMTEKRIVKAVERANAAKGAGSLEAIASGNGLKVDTTAMVHAKDWLPTGGRELGMTVAAKSVPLNTLTGPVRGQQGAYFFMVTERNPADSTQFAAQLTSQTNQVLQRRQQQLYNDFIAQLKKDAKIEDFRFLMYSDF